MKTNKPANQIITDQDFHLGDVLSITTGRMLSPEGIDGIYKILNFITGDNLYTHQLTRAARAAKPFILKQHPKLKQVDINNLNTENYKEWLNQQIELFGEMVTISPMSPELYTKKDPYQEMVELFEQKET